MKPGGFVESFAFGGGVPEDRQTELGCVMCNFINFVVYFSFIAVV